MNIGNLDRKILIENLTTTPDPVYGSPVETWVEVARAWASVLDVLAGSREATNQDIRLTAAPVKITMRYMAGITAKMRVTVLETGRVLQIVTPPAEIKRREFLQFIAEQYSV